MNWANQQEQERKLCSDAHRCNGVIPQSHNIELDGLTCDCKKFIFRAEKCSCPNGGTILKQYPNQ